METVKHSGGYPYFIQFLCREMFDSYFQERARGKVNPVVTVAQTVRKLDSDFFAGRWNRVTDRQRELLAVVTQALGDALCLEPSKRLRQRSLGCIVLRLALPPSRDDFLFLGVGLLTRVFHPVLLCGRELPIDVSCLSGFHVLSL